MQMRNSEGELQSGHALDEVPLRSSHGQDVLNPLRNDPMASAADVEPGGWLESQVNELMKSLRYRQGNRKTILPLVAVTSTSSCGVHTSGCEKLEQVHRRAVKED